MPRHPRPSFQVLLCLYCFLAGVAVSTGRLLWLLPAATAASAAVHWAAGAASQLALPFYKDLPAERAALWRVDAAHLAYSSLTGERRPLLRVRLWWCFRHMCRRRRFGGAGR